MNDQNEKPVEKNQNQKQREKNQDKPETNNKPFHVTLLSSVEGCLLLVGVGISFIYILWLIIAFNFWPEKTQAVIGMTSTQILFGRASAMAFGYSVGLNPPLVITLNIIIETVLVLIFYPLFVFSWRHILVVPFLKNTLGRLHKAAELHKDKVHRYGFWGLLLFVWFPFWMTGPVVGAIIGFLLGFSAPVTIFVVTAGTCAAVFCWAILLHGIHEKIAAYSPYATFVLVLILIGVVLIGHFLHREHMKHVRDKNENQNLN